MRASPRGVAAATLAVSPPRIDAPANLKGGCLRRSCRRRNFVRHCPRVIVANSPLKTEIPGVLKGVNFGASRRKAVLIYRAEQSKNRPIPLYQSTISLVYNSRTEMTVTLRALRQ